MLAPARLLLRSDHCFSLVIVDLGSVRTDSIGASSCCRIAGGVLAIGRQGWQLGDDLGCEPSLVVGQEGCTASLAAARVLRREHGRPRTARKRQALL